MQRLSEELEQQGEAVNFHADLVRQKDVDVQAVLKHLKQAHQELVVMEPPKLSEAISGIEVLLRVSTGEASTKGGDSENTDGVHGTTLSPKTWCFVRYSRVSRGQRRPSDAKAGAVTGDDHAGAAVRLPDSSDDCSGGDDGSPGDLVEPNPAGEEVQGSGEVDKHEDVVHSQVDDPTYGDKNRNQCDLANEGTSVDADPLACEERSSPGSPPATPKTRERSEDALEVIMEWRTQEDVDEWFAHQLATDPMASSPGEDSQAADEQATGGLADMLAPIRPAEESAKAVEIPVLKLPPTVQESSGVEVARVRQELEDKLEEAKAELSRNTEAYNQYRARVSRWKERGFVCRTCVLRIRAVHQRNIHTRACS